jgi:ABC-type multidrug transport system fused ATPase/permease subunit
VKYCGSIGYCPQKPWIINRSIKANITMGEKLNEARLQEVIDSAAMADDID